MHAIIVSATRQYKAALARSIHAGIDSGLLERWRQALVTPREAGLSQQSSLWAAPAKHSPRRIEELLERIETIETVFFLRYCLLIGTDRVLLMVRRRSRICGAVRPRIPIRC